MDTLKLIAEYVEGNKNRWSDATLKSEAARLTKVAEYINGDPQALWDALEGLKYGHYTKTTIWTRCTHFWSHLVETKKVRDAGGGNPYREFRTKNSRLFSNAYVFKPSRFAFDDIREKVSAIKNETVREKAMELLTSGLRFNESLEKKEGSVIGKGAKVRSFLGPNESAGWDYSYATFYKELAKVGLKPHDLRKAFASRLVDEGINPFDLCSVMGWSKMSTALSYVKTKTDTQMKEFIKKAVSKK